MNGTTLEAKSKIIESSWTKLNHGGDRMTIEEILAGESKNVEFKVQRPDKSMKYMKTVVAFANGKGGRIIFGIDDKTREVVGIPEDKVFREIDAITNAISDSCEPTIIPDVYLQNINDKPVIVAEIRTGRRKPYYIKAEGWRMVYIFEFLEQHALLIVICQESYIMNAMPALLIQ